jgi:hypothetical protein
MGTTEQKGVEAVGTRRWQCGLFAFLSLFLLLFPSFAFLHLFFLLFLRPVSFLVFLFPWYSLPFFFGYSERGLGPVGNSIEQEELSSLSLLFLLGKDVEAFSEFQVL